MFIKAEATLNSVKKTLMLDQGLIRVRMKIGEGRPVCEMDGRKEEKNSNIMN